MGATDANRYVVRSLRAATGRQKIPVLNGCYHGTIEGVFVDLVDGQPVQWGCLIGQIHDLIARLAALDRVMRPAPSTA